MNGQYYSVVLSNILMGSWSLIGNGDLICCADLREGLGHSQPALSPTWNNIDPSVDGWLYSIYSMGWNYLSIPNIEGVLLVYDKKLHPRLYWASDYLYMLGSKLIHVSETGTASTLKAMVNRIAPYMEKIWCCLVVYHLFVCCNLNLSFFVHSSICLPRAISIAVMVVEMELTRV